MRGPIRRPDVRLDLDDPADARLACVIVADEQAAEQGLGRLERRGRERRAGEGRQRRSSAAEVEVPKKALISSGTSGPVIAKTAGMRVSRKS